MAIKQRRFPVTIGTPQNVEMAQGEDCAFAFSFTEPPPPRGTGAQLDFSTASGFQLVAKDRQGLLLFARLGGLVRAWAPTTSFVATNYCVNGGNVYHLTAPGTSGNAGGPTGTGTGIVDGGCTWDFFGTLPQVGDLVFVVTQTDTVNAASQDYDFDVTFADAQGYQEQLQLASTFMLDPGVRKPGDPITSAPPIPVTYGINWQGAWNNATTYQINDGVSYPDPNGGASNGLSTFRAVVSNTNVPPLDNSGNLSADWVYVAKRGVDGAPAGGIITSDVLTVPVVEVGATVVNPSGTASYSLVPASASVSDGSTSQSVASPFTSWTFTGSYLRTVVNAIVAFTLTAIDAFNRSFSAVANLQWQARAYYGTGVIPDGTVAVYDANYVTGLTSSRLQPGFVNSYTIAGDDGTGTVLVGDNMFPANPPNIVVSSGFVSVEGGVKFQVAVNGYVDALRFWKGSLDTATTHTLHLWNLDTNTLLATATTSSETMSTWNTATLGSHVNLTAGVNYAVTVGYLNHAPAVQQPVAPPVVSDQMTILDGIYNLTLGSQPNTTLSTSFYVVDAHFVYTVAAPKYRHIFMPAAWGDPSQFVDGGLIVPWTKVVSNLNVTNGQGVVIAYNGWRAPQAVLSSHITQVS